MGFWNYLFGKRPKLSDAFFGEMTFIEVPNDPASSYFECERYFKPIDGLIELGVTGQLSGPMQRQKYFFTQLENDYQLIIAAVIPVIESEFQQWKPNFKLGNFEQEFKPVWLEIPTCDQRPVEWEIFFETVHDLNHHICVTMQDYRPLHVLMDG